MIEDQESIEGFLVFDHLEPDASSPPVVMYSPKTREGSARSAVFSKLRTRARRNCEHALVECSQFCQRRVTGMVLSQRQ